MAEGRLENTADPNQMALNFARSPKPDIDDEKKLRARAETHDRNRFDTPFIDLVTYAYQSGLGYTHRDNDRSSLETPTLAESCINTTLHPTQTSQQDHGFLGSCRTTNRQNQRFSEPPTVPTYDAASPQMRDNCRFRPTPLLNMSTPHEPNIDYSSTRNPALVDPHTMTALTLNATPIPTSTHGPTTKTTAIPTTDKDATAFDNTQRIDIPDHHAVCPSGPQTPCLDTTTVRRQPYPNALCLDHPVKPVPTHAPASCLATDPLFDATPCSTTGLREREQRRANVAHANNRIREWLAQIIYEPPPRTESRPGRHRPPLNTTAEERVDPNLREYRYDYDYPDAQRKD
ncbi:hypothetical protein EDB86DRAFT_3082629 [Lactarius hatsudake]|nr:hypothetical protein EDB86DRAFT_3082629 [Lactarius hatsudake]